MLGKGLITEWTGSEQLTVNDSQNSPDEEHDDEGDRLLAVRPGYPFDEGNVERKWRNNHDTVEHLQWNNNIVYIEILNYLYW